jgi:hypothetical protein
LFVQIRRATEWIILSRVKSNDLEAFRLFKDLLIHSIMSKTLSNARVDFFSFCFKQGWLFIIHTNKCTTYIYKQYFVIVSTPTCFDSPGSSSGGLIVLLCWSYKHHEGYKLNTIIRLKYLRATYVKIGIFVFLCVCFKIFEL